MEKLREGKGWKGKGGEDPPAFRLPIVDGGSSVIVSIVLETTLSPEPVVERPEKGECRSLPFHRPPPARSRPGPTTPGFDPLLSSRWTKNKNS